MRDIKILKNRVRLWRVHLNKNVMLIFYVKYNVNVFPKNTVPDVKNKKENIEMMRSYPLNVFQMIISFLIFL